MKHSFTKTVYGPCYTHSLLPHNRYLCANRRSRYTATAITSEVITATETTVEEGSVDDTVSQLVSGVNTV